MSASFRDTVNANVERLTECGCWIWMLGVGDNGYGYTDFDSERRAAHVRAYEEFVGPVPEGLVLDHLCRVRCCVNPDHLEPVPNRTNVLRGIGPSAENARKTHCKNGHPFDDETQPAPYMRPGRRYAERRCRHCSRVRLSESYYRHLERRRADAREYQRRRRAQASGRSLA